MKKKSDRPSDTLTEAIARELQKANEGRPIHRAAGENGANRAGAGKPIAGAGKRRGWLFLLLCLVGSTVVSFVVFKYVAPSIPQELVGTWEVTEGPLKAATLEFRWYGTLIATSNGKDHEKTTQTVKVVGNVILMSSKDASTGKDDTVAQTILKLTEDELVIRDEDRRTYHLKRVCN